MKRSFYAERDYAFGQRMLTLRSAIGLTQAGLAQHLGVSRKAVGGGRQAAVIPHLIICNTSLPWPCEPLGTLRRDRPYERLNITGIRGLTQAQKATLRALGAVEDGKAASW